MIAPLLATEDLDTLARGSYKTCYRRRRERVRSEDSARASRGWWEARRGERPEHPPRAAGPKAKGLKERFLSPGVNKTDRVRPLQRSADGARVALNQKASIRASGVVPRGSRKGSRPRSGARRSSVRLR